MSEPELNDIWASEVVRLRDERDRLCSALRAALDDVPGWVELARAALTPAGQRLTPNEATE